MKYRMAIRYFMIPCNIVGHTVFHDSHSHDDLCHPFLDDLLRYFMDHEILYGHTVFHGIMKYRMAIRYFMIL